MLQAFRRPQQHREARCCVKYFPIVCILCSQRWSQWIVPSPPHQAQPGSLPRACLGPSKDSWTRCGFGKVFHSELMIPSIRHDSQFYIDLYDLWSCCPFWNFRRLFLLIPTFSLERWKGRDIKQLTSWLKYRHELFTRQSSQLEAGENWIQSSPPPLLGMCSPQCQEEGKKVMNDGWWSEAELSLHAKSGLGTCRRQAEASVCGSLEYLHVKARTEIF